MNQKTARLIRKFAVQEGKSEKQVKAYWLSYPPRQRAVIRKIWEEVLGISHANEQPAND